MEGDAERVAQSKAQLRQELKSRWAALDPFERARQSALVRARVLDLAAWREARSVALFDPRGDEPDVRPLFAEALRTGRRVAFPGWDPDSETYCFREVCGEGDFVLGRFGLREPSQDCPRFGPESLDLALVPGVAFTLDGARLGRGRGFYDRLLASFRGTACGVCFDFQVLEKIPVAAHDVKLQRVLSPTSATRDGGG
jgi:5-formyltetrahydrofolate cyclo-ligase